MALHLEDLIQALGQSRAHFLKHVDGMSEEQWDWKPYPECKSVRETIAHLIIDEVTYVDSLVTGGEPAYDAQEDHSGKSREDLLSLLEEGFRKRIETLRSHLQGKEMDAEICVWGGKSKLAPGVLYFSSEDYYHAGQVAFIRQATDPTWNYYAAIYA